MKHAYLITDTDYKMLNQALFLEIMYRYDIRRHVQNQNKDLSMRKKMFEICHLTLTHMILAVFLI